MSGWIENQLYVRVAAQFRELYMIDSMRMSMTLQKLGGKQVNALGCVDSRISTQAVY